MQSVYLRQVADPQAASFVPGLAPDLEPGSPITIHNCPSLSVLDDNFQFQLPLGSNLTFLFESTSLLNNWFRSVPTAQSSSLYTCSSWRDANLCHLASTSSFTFNFTQDCVFHLNLMQYIFIHFYSLSRGHQRFTILAKCC